MNSSTKIQPTQNPKEYRKNDTILLVDGQFVFALVNTLGGRFSVEASPEHQLLQ